MIACFRNEHAVPWTKPQDFEVTDDHWRDELQLVVQRDGNSYNVPGKLDYYMVITADGDSRLTMRDDFAQ